MDNEADGLQIAAGPGNGAQQPPPPAHLMTMQQVEDAWVAPSFLFGSIPLEPPPPEHCH
jgi:hypothetical protein